MNSYLQLFDFPPEQTRKLAASLIILLVLWVGKLLVGAVIGRRITDPARFYRWNRAVVYTFSFAGIILIGRVWIKGIDSIATFLGLTGAGFAIAMHDTIANLTGWFYIVWRQPFKVGDRIQIDKTSGDVIDVRILEFSIIEIGNWVNADQSTGRIIHIPNAKVLREPLANYETGFEHIWHEVPVLVTFESDWEKAKRILTTIAEGKVARLADGAEAQMRKAAMKYFIHFKHLTPIVYTTVKESGVLLTIRYIVRPRERRSSEQEIWEAILRAFRQEKDIALAYPTTRPYAEGDAGLPKM